MKRGLLFFLLIVTGLGFLRLTFAAQVVPALPSQPDYLTPQAIAGVDATDEIIPIRVDSSGNLVVSVSGGSPAIAPFNFNVNIPAVGPTDRTQLPSNTATSCTVQAVIGNLGSIYIGGATVTNSLGTNRGIEIIQGSTFGPVTVTNSNQIYVATDNTGDDVTVFCN